MIVAICYSVCQFCSERRTENGVEVAAQKVQLSVFWRKIIRECERIKYHSGFYC